MKNDNIFVTKSYLPPIENYETYIKKIWDSGQLTNQGPLLKDFELKVKNLLDTSSFHFVTNGTLAIQLALRAIDINPGDEVITTPFSYVATTSAILWERAVPKYVDIDSTTLNIDPKLIENAITPRTKAILAVHVFGRPCDTDEIEKIASNHNLKVIYDAAHAFGVEVDGKSLLSKGDISTCSFHATKVFHTIEGGGIISSNNNLSEKLEMLKRFGHEGDHHNSVGINAKASEFQAAMGLSLLPYLDKMIEDRKDVHNRYNKILDNNLLISYEPLKNVKHNYAYYPIVLGSSEIREKVLAALETHNIFARRYFYPSLNTLPYVKYTVCNVSEDITERIICLPIYPGLTEDDVDKISGIVNEAASLD